MQPLRGIRIVEEWFRFVSSQAAAILANNSLVIVVVNLFISISVQCQNPKKEEKMKLSLLQLL